MNEIADGHQPASGNGLPGITERDRQLFLAMAEGDDLAKLLREVAIEGFGREAANQFFGGGDPSLIPRDMSAEDSRLEF